MSIEEVYYCPEDPTGHLEFEAYVALNANWLVDREGEYIKELYSEVNEINEHECAECGASAEWGTPPSALEVLAQAAE